MALDINGYNATFRTFVEFAEKTQRDGYDSACANATLAGKRITVSALSLHETSYVLRKTGEKTVNDSTRAIFRNAVAEMFGGEAKIPESVKKAMLLGDYGDGRPLTTRRIMAVKDAIDAEDSMREKGVSQFASPATREAALAKDAETGAVTIRYSSPTALPVKFSWTATIAVDGSSTSTPMVIEQPQ